MNFKAIALGFVVILATTVTASAKHRYHHQYAPQSPQYYGAYQPISHVRVAKHYKKRYASHSKRSKKHRHDDMDANGNALYATITTAKGLTATVIATAKEKFQGFINDVEKDFVNPEPPFNVIKGNRITGIACKSSGHMPGSKHHWGGACDIGNQLRRNVVLDKFMYHVTEIAHKWGLTDGCTWGRQRRERFTGPDCGHIEVPGSNSRYANQTYRMALK